MISSSTAAAVPLPRWGRLWERLRAWENGAFVTQINQNLHCRAKSKLPNKICPKWISIPFKNQSFDMT
jgi:hypothetical protein